MNTNIGRRVAGVVVTYNPCKKTLEQLLRATVPQTQGVVIVDNTSAGGAELPHISSSDVVVISNGENVGLAAAENQGIRGCFWQGDQENLLLDDNQTLQYRNGCLAERERLRYHAWRQVSPSTRG
jgi:rhamnosyltransferase